jgi:peroxiredoxin
MSTNHKPDRLIRAWLDLMPDEAPDRAIADVLQAIESTPQVRRPLIPALRRFPPMNRLTFLAAAAAVIAVLVGGGLLLRPSANIGGPPPASATASPPGQSQGPASAPDALRSTWLADGGPGAGGSAGSAIRLVFSSAGNQVSILDAGVSTFKSKPVAGPADELDLALIGSDAGCQVGDIGRYRFALSSDGTFLTLTSVADACAARASQLGRPWVLAIDANNKGGRGVAAAFAPMFLMTLPVGGYAADVGADSLTLTSTSPDRTLIAVRNPVGFADPCSSTGGSKLPVAPTIKAFTAYMKTLPGFTVQSSNLEIDGKSAVLLTIPSTATDTCPSHRVMEWSAGAPGAKGGWLLTQGDTDIVYLVEVNGSLVLMQWLGAGVTTAEEQGLLSTVHFTDTLPVAP